MKRTREEIINDMPFGGRMAEIGTYEGDFAQTIVDYLDPHMLYLIDPWCYQQGMNDTTNQKQSEQEDRAKKVYKRFLYHDNVQIVRLMSKSMTEIFPNDFFDFMYIDGDHSKEGCYKDLETCLKLTTQGGIIGVDDFDPCWPGVYEAVNIFVKNNKENLELFDKCYSTDEGTSSPNIFFKKIK